MSEILTHFETVGRVPRETPFSYEYDGRSGELAVRYGGRAARFAPGPARFVPNCVGCYGDSWDFGWRGPMAPSPAVTPSPS